MPTPDDQIVKGFQRLIAPSADADDGVDYADATDDTMLPQRKLFPSGTGSCCGAHANPARDREAQCQEPPWPSKCLARARACLAARGSCCSRRCCAHRRRSPATPPETGGSRSGMRARSGSTRWSSWRWMWNPPGWRLVAIDFGGRRRHLLDSKPGAHFQRLINPGRRIPQFITRFTGISEAMVKRAGSAAEILPKAHEFIDNGPNLAA